MSRNGLFLFLCLILFIAPYVHSWSPIKIPNASDQCKAIKGKNYAGACITRPKKRSTICTELYCALALGQMRYRGVFEGQPMNGMECGHMMVCQEGKCVEGRQDDVRFVGPPGTFLCK